jgi:ABC-2 type transport system ATP-binding protein
MTQTQVSTAPAMILPDLAVEIRGLNKLYGGSGSKRPPKQAVTDFSLEVPRGSFFGLLGPNGAGKSTTINVLAGLVRKTSGSVRIWDCDIDTQERQARCAIGVVPQELNLDPFFTPFEVLEVQAGLYGVPKAERRTKEILDLVGLADKANAYARALSRPLCIHRPWLCWMNPPPVWTWNCVSTCGGTCAN